MEAVWWYSLKQSVAYNWLTIPYPLNLSPSSPQPPSALITLSHSSHTKPQLHMTLHSTTPVSIHYACTLHCCTISTAPWDTSIEYDIKERQIKLPHHFKTTPDACHYIINTNGKCRAHGTATLLYYVHKATHDYHNTRTETLHLDTHTHTTWYDTNITP